jgi:hypothetical protein
MARRRQSPKEDRMLMQMVTAIGRASASGPVVDPADARRRRSA